MDNVTDSWLFDAEDWFKLKYNITDWNSEDTYWFCKFLNDKFVELYSEKYGKRDVLFELDKVAYDVWQISKMFERIKQRFKKISKFNDAISSTFETL